MFSKQFTVSAVQLPLPEGWCRRALGDQHVASCPDLPIIRLLADGCEGLVFGWPIHEGKLHKHGDTLTLGGTGGAPLFRTLAGRFLALLAYGSTVHCYLDPCGMLPAVFSKSQRILASTPGLIPAGEDSAGQPEVRAAIKIPIMDNWYPFGFTGAGGVSRLLPNHVLNLADYSCERFWPTERTLPLEDRPAGCVAAIAELLQENARAIAAQDRIMCNLTAGRDTRMILAALRGEIGKVTFCTIRVPDKLGNQDCDMARRIATDQGLRFREIPYHEPVAADREEWLRDTGYCVAGRTMDLATTSKAIGMLTDYNITGLAGEIGRASDWRPGDLQKRCLSPAELITRLRLHVPRVAALEKAASAWMEGLPPGPPPWILDISMIEMAMAAHAGPSFYGHCHGGVSISPFNDRRIIDLMLALPYEYRFEQRLASDIIERMWPELNAYPFNPAQVPMVSGFRKKFEITFPPAFLRDRSFWPRRRVV